MSEPTEYKGETKARSPKLATALSFLAPGLGLVYVGEPIRGLLANLGFIVLLEAFIIVFASVKFFPLLPGLVLTLVWLTYATFTARVARRAIRGEEYLLKSTNHPLIYAVFALLTFVGPVLATAQFTATRLVSIVPIHDAGMIPTLRPGDFALVDRTTFQKRLPARGELLAVIGPGQFLVLRAIAAAGDAVRFEGDVVFVNEEPLARAPVQLAVKTDEVMHIVEANGDQQYLLAFSPRVHNYAMTNIAEVPNNTVFALADNRSLVPADGGPAQTRDSRAFGPVDAAQLLGKPLFIAWSFDPATGSVRWDRIGLRVQ